MVQDKITEKYGNGWMMGSAFGGVQISFDYDVDSLIFEESFKKEQEELV